MKQELTYEIVVVSIKDAERTERSWEDLTDEEKWELSGIWTDRFMTAAGYEIEERQGEEEGSGSKS